jgi:hypothetical protein
MPNETPAPPNPMHTRVLHTVVLLSLMAGVYPATVTAARPTPPTRDPHAPGSVPATELPDGAAPPVDVGGNFIVGPTHNHAPEMAVQPGVPQGTIHNLTMKSVDSKIYPGIAREPGTFGTVDPTDPARLAVTTSHLAPYTRRHRSLSGRTVPTGYCSRRWTISSPSTGCP